MLRYEFTFHLAIDGKPIAEIGGFAEIMTGGHVHGGWYWSIGRIFVQPIGANPVLLPATHHLHQQIMLWLLQSNAAEIDDLVRRGLAA